MKKTNSKQVKSAMDKDIQRDFREIRDGARDKLSPPVKDYLGALVDPRRHGKAGIPTLMGGIPGHTGNEYYRLQGEVVIGVNSVGYLCVAPLHLQSTSIHGPLAGSIVAMGTTAGSTATILPTAGATIPTGDFVASLPTLLGTGSMFDKADFQARVVGVSIEIFPDSSWSVQDGRISMLEWPGHAAPDQPTTVNEFESNKSTRTVRAAQSKGDIRDKIVLNWHPRVSLPYGEAQIDDFQFIDLYGRSASVTAFGGPLTFMFIGSPGSSFHYDISFLYETRGRLVNSTKARLVDSRGMDLVNNMIAAKQLSGYLGNPVHVQQSYLTMAWEMGKKLWGQVKEPAKDAALLALKEVAGFV